MQQLPEVPHQLQRSAGATAMIYFTLSVRNQASSRASPTAPTLSVPVMTARESVMAMASYRIEGLAVAISYVSCAAATELAGLL